MPGLLRRALNLGLVGHIDPLGLIDNLAGMIGRHDRELEELRRRADVAEARLGELYVDASIIGRLEAGYSRRGHA